MPGAQRWTVGYVTSRVSPYVLMTHMVQGPHELERVNVLDSIQRTEIQKYNSWLKKTD